MWTRSEWQGQDLVFLDADGNEKGRIPHREPSLLNRLYLHRFEYDVLMEYHLRQALRAGLRLNLALIWSHLHDVRIMARFRRGA